MTMETQITRLINTNLNRNCRKVNFCNSACPSQNCLAPKKLTPFLNLSLAYEENL